MRKATLLAALDAQRESLLCRVAAMTDDAWDQPCAVSAAGPHGWHPQRTVREVVAHLLLTDAAAVRRGAIRAQSRRLEMPGAWDPRRVSPLAARPPEDLVAALARRGERLARSVAATPAPLGRLPLAGPAGRSRVADLLCRRVLHEWLHEQDIVWALGPATLDSPVPAVAQVIVGAVLRILPRAVLPQVDADRGVVRLVVDVPRGADAVASAPTVWSADFARRHYGPRVAAAPDATIRLDAATLALLANGRGDRVPAAVTVDGDAALAAAFLDVLAFPAEAGGCVSVPAVAS